MSLVFSANVRDRSGTGSSRAIRREDRIPSVVYGDEKSNLCVSVDFAQFYKEYMKGNIRSKIATLELHDQKIMALIKDVQVHRVTGLPVHIDFLRVNADSYVRVAINVRINGADQCSGIKRGGVLNVVYRAIPFFCKPHAIPVHFDVDVTDLEIGKSLHINDIELPDGLKPVNKENFVVVSLVGREKDEPTAK